METDLEQKRLEKRQYDKIYRAKNKELIKKKKAEYFKKTYDPARQSEIRKTSEYREKHKAYCAQEKYKTGYKKDYDKKYRAKRKYGAMAETFIVLLDLKKEIRNKATAYQVRLDKGHYRIASKKYREKKKNGKVKCDNAKGAALGNLEPC